VDNIYSNNIFQYTEPWDFSQAIAYFDISKH